MRPRDKLAGQIFDIIQEVMKDSGEFGFEVDAMVDYQNAMVLYHVNKAVEADDTLNIRIKYQDVIRASAHAQGHSDFIAQWACKISNAIDNRNKVH